MTDLTEQQLAEYEAAREQLRVWLQPETSPGSLEYIEATSRTEAAIRAHDEEAP